MEISIHNNFIFQLDHEPTRHRLEVSGLIDMAFKWIYRWSKKKQKLNEPKKENLDLSMDLKKLNKMKLQLTESLLERLDQPKKVMNDIADLQKILSRRNRRLPLFNRY